MFRERYIKMSTGNIDLILICCQSLLWVHWQLRHWYAASHRSGWVLVHRHFELSRHTSPLLEPKESSILVSIRCSCLHCDKLLFVFLSELYGLKLHQTDTQQTYQLGQFTGCLRSHRPIITEEFFKLYPSHRVHHEVNLCRPVFQLGRLERWERAGWCWVAP